jgi:hypothetical protein
MYAHYGYVLLWSVQPLPILSLTPLHPTLHFSTAFNTHPYILYLIDLMFYDIIDALSFSFSFPPSQDPDSSSTIINMFYI